MIVLYHASVSKYDLKLISNIQKVKYHIGPRGGGTSRAMNPLRHTSVMPSPVLKIYWKVHKPFLESKQKNSQVSINLSIILTAYFVVQYAIQFKYVPTHFGMLLLLVFLWNLISQYFYLRLGLFSVSCFYF